MTIRADVPSGHASAPILGTERMGAGTIVEPTGLVLTAHYLAIGARTIEVGPTEGESIPGRVVGIDYEAGVAAIDIATARLPGLTIRETDASVVGEEAFLVATVEDGRRVGSGLVTAYAPFEAFWEYMVDHALSCSAASPGLGGGPLVDARGEMLGVVSLSLLEVGKFTLAIPASRAAGLLDGIAREGRYVNPRPRGWIGITCYPVGENVIVAAALPETPAEAAGLSSGDIIEAVDGIETADRRGLYMALGAGPPGSARCLRIRRGGDRLEIEVMTGSIEEFFAS